MTENPCNNYNVRFIIVFEVKYWFLSKIRVFSICGVNKVGKKCSNRKNKVTFIHKTFLGPGMEVTLFLRFGQILILKMVSKDSQL